ncbi:MAG: DNA polymerase III subunit chi [Oleiphilaceae bacterium]|nr:DNA polymerase III subunit chi [Oleiphilaceae bacterium]
MRDTAPQHWFYLLAEDSETARLHHAARLAEKAWRQGDRVALYCRDGEQAGQLDEILWAFRPDAFLPHARLGPEDEAGGQSVVVLCHAPSPQQWQTLIVLSPQLPQHSEHFRRLALIASSDPSVLQQAREQYRQLRERGVTPQVLDLRSRHV